MSFESLKIELLKKVDFFSRLRLYEIDIIAQNSDFVPFEKGEPIFARDMGAESLYVVQQGRVGILGYESEESINVARIIEGEAFGYLEFLAGENRSASAFAEEKTILLKFPHNKTMEEILSEHPSISAQLLYRLMSTISERIWETKKMIYEKNSQVWDLHKKMNSDKLTGLYNKNFLSQDFLSMLPDLGKGAALMMIKPDNFKEVNDRFGHETGDRALTMMAIFLQSEMKETDIAIRYMGDEFGALLVDTDREEAIGRARNISKAFKAMDLTHLTGGKNLSIQVSIGVMLFPLQVGSSEEMVAAAHEKMLKAREKGGNRISI